MKDSKIVKDTSDYQISVAILLDDMATARDLSNIFKEIGVAPNFYTDLRSFWYETLNKVPTLCIVDVKKMSEGEIILRNHPFVLNEELPLVFYYSDETSPLLLSTFEMYHVGAIRKSSNYRGQIKSILKRVNKLMGLEKSLVNEKIKVSKIEIQANKLIENNEFYREKSYFTQNLKQLGKHIDKEKNEGVDFLKSLEEILAKFSEVDKFSLLELGYSGQKLISPQSMDAKFCKIPSLWLGQVCTQGIEVFGQNMASQVALDILGGELISLLIKGKQALPDKLLFIKTKNIELLKHFDWAAFESQLSSLYQSFLLKRLSLKRDHYFLSPWELASVLDQFKYGMAATESTILPQIEMALIKIDLSSMMQIVLNKRKYRFFWKNFYQQFTTALIESSSREFKICLWGESTVLLLVQKSFLDQVLPETQSFIKKYPFWKFFDDVDAFLTEEMKVEVKQIPFAYEALHREIGLNKNTSQTFIEFANDTDHLKTSAEVDFWSKAPQLDM